MYLQRCLLLRMSTISTSIHHKCANKTGDRANDHHRRGAEKCTGEAAKKWNYNEPQKIRQVPLGEKNVLTLPLFLDQT